MAMRFRWDGDGFFDGRTMGFGWEDDRFLVGRTMGLPFFNFWSDNMQGS